MSFRPNITMKLVDVMDATDRLELPSTRNCIVWPTMAGTELQDSRDGLSCRAHIWGTNRQLHSGCAELAEQYLSI